MNPLSDSDSPGDARLVEQCLQGNRSAFGQIVARYQTLVCSLAYSACGDLSRSEDLAQDTFVAAWRDLSRLKEPGKLKSWLCGITRNLISNSQRRDLRTPTAQASALEPDLHGGGESPDTQAMSREEESLVWHALETVPAEYREPLVLYYRENQSTRAVGLALNLSDDAVRQRLSRGRALLNDRLSKTVESVLLRSVPGKAFTVGVLAAIPAFTLSAKAATIGVGAVQGSTAAKTAIATGLVGSVLTPIVSFLGVWAGYRMNLATAQSDRERAFVSGFYRRLSICVGAFTLLFFVLMCFAERLMATHDRLFTGLVIGIAVAYLAAVGALTVWASRRRRELQFAAKSEGPSPASSQVSWEYRSKLTLLGLPLVHICMRDKSAEPVRAWIAAGGAAYGLLFAFGGFAVAPISMGGCAVGLFAFGGCGVGLLTLGGMAFGVWSFGGLAFGWQAFGACAIAWDAAMGAVAIGREGALGSLAKAAEVNTPELTTRLGANPFFYCSAMLLPHLFWLNALWFLPMLAWWRMAVRLKNAALTKQAVV